MAEHILSGRAHHVLGRLGNLRRGNTSCFLLPIVYLKIKLRYFSDNNVFTFIPAIFQMIILVFNDILIGL